MNLQQMTDTQREPLLKEREATHGNFGRNAMISQEIKRTMRGYLDWFALHPVHREALEMIALKLSRILSGQAGYKDHWDDIAGYAKLAAERCRQEPTKTVKEHDETSR